MESRHPSTASWEAWRRYTRTGSLEAALLRPVVLRAWERSHAQRLDPALRVPEVRSPGEMQQLRESNAELIASASSYMEALAVAAGAARHATLLGARDATVLSVLGDAESMGGLDRAPAPGSRMDEQHAGANGLGTALIENDYVELVQTEHFISGFHHHTCHGIPLYGAAGELVGAMCLSVRAPSVAQRLRQLLIMASRGIQMELAAARLRRRFQDLRHHPSQDAELLVTLHQEIVQAHAAARLQVEVGARRFDHAGEALIAAANDSIQRFARGARVWQLASGFTPEDPVSTSELLMSAIELMRTDAAIHHVELHAEAEDGAHGVASSELARDVISRTEKALRSVGEGGEVVLRLVEGAVQLDARSRRPVFRPGSQRH